MGTCALEHLACLCSYRDPHVACAHMHHSCPCLRLLFQAPTPPPTPYNASVYFDPYHGRDGGHTQAQSAKVRSRHKIQVETACRERERERECVCVCVRDSPLLSLSSSHILTHRHLHFVSGCCATFWHADGGPDDGVLLCDCTATTSIAETSCSRVQRAISPTRKCVSLCILFIPHSP